MIWLIIGVLLFVGVHLVKPAAPELRGRLVHRLGDAGWRMVVVALLVLSIWLMGKGYGAADAPPLWIAPDWMRLATFILMLPAFMLFFSTYPGSWLRAHMRHPQLTGFKLWATLHLIVNGDLPSLVLFGGLLAWAVFAVISINRRDGKRPLPAASSNPLVAFGFIGIGLVVWAAVYWAHGAVFDVYPLS